MSKCPLCQELVDRLVLCPIIDELICKDCKESNEEHFADFAEIP